MEPAEAVVENGIWTIISTDRATLVTKKYIHVALAPERPHLKTNLTFHRDNSFYIKTESAEHKTNAIHGETGSNVNRITNAIWHPEDFIWRLAVPKRRWHWHCCLTEKGWRQLMPLQTLRGIEMIPMWNLDLYSHRKTDRKLLKNILSHREYFSITHQSNFKKRTQ